MGLRKLRPPKADGYKIAQFLFCVFLAIFAALREGSFLSLRENRLFNVKILK